MKGIIYVLYKTYVTESYGEEVLNKVITESRLPSVIIATKNYPDEYIVSLINATARVTGKSLDNIEFEFGRKIIPHLYKTYPIFFKPEYNAKDFLLGMDYVHGEATKALDANPPRFEYENPSPNELVMFYSSKKRLCTFMKGLITGVLDFYNEKGRIDEPSCIKKGAPRCEVRITFEG